MKKVYMAVIMSSMVFAIGCQKKVNTGTVSQRVEAPTQQESLPLSPEAIALQEAKERLKNSYIDKYGKLTDMTGRFYLDDKGNIIGERKPSMVDLLLERRVILFDYDASTISTEDNSILQVHASYLKQNPTAKIRLEGHTDSRGTREYNMALGERRAKAVEAFMSFSGVSNSQLDLVSYGKEKPKVYEDTEEAWAQNRRVELNYTDKAPEPFYKSEIKE